MSSTVSQAEIVPLETVLAYNCRTAIHVFLRAWPVAERSAEELWEDTLAWLWLGKLQQIDKAEGMSPLTIVGPLIPVDEMWHSFILCTEDYHRACNTFFGGYLHHAPETDRSERFTKEQYAEQLRYVSLRLGPQRAFRLYVSNALTFEGMIRIVESRNA